LAIISTTPRVIRPAFTHPVNRRVLTPADIKRERQARLMIKLIAGLAALSLALAVLAQATGLGAMKTNHGAAIATFDVTLKETADGGIALAALKDGAVIAGFDKGHGGFLRGALRAFSMHRKQQDIAPDAPFTVTRWESGRITLTDSATHETIPVDAFGPSVTKMFAPLVGDN
jgi:putative photosynthetic complex assembly protein